MNLLDVHAIILIWEEKSYNLNCFKLDFFKTITKQVMTAYTKLEIIHIGTDVNIRVRGTRGKLLSKLLVSVYFCLRWHREV